MTKKLTSVAKFPVTPPPPIRLLNEEQVLTAAEHILAQHGNSLDMYTLYEAICDTYHVQFTDPDKKDYGIMLARIHTILCVNDRHFAWDPARRTWIYGTFHNTAKNTTTMEPSDDVPDSPDKVLAIQ